jgi:hypothetical protein
MQLENEVYLILFQKTIVNFFSECPEIMLLSFCTRNGNNISFFIITYLPSWSTS